MDMILPHWILMLVPFVIFLAARGSAFLGTYS
jgi:hypothetical protein